MTKKGFDIATQRRLYFALKMIAREYQTPGQLRRSAGEDYSLDYSEALEMAYENIQSLAANAIRGLRVPKEKADG